jgi:hypothetical protein
LAAKVFRFIDAGFHLTLQKYPDHDDKVMFEKVNTMEKYQEDVERCHTGPEMNSSYLYA